MTTFSVFTLVNRYTRHIFDWTTTNPYFLRLITPNRSLTQKSSVRNPLDQLIYHSFL